MATPKDVHVLTLIERLFVPNMLKKKNQEQIILLGCQHQSMPWILTEPGQKQEGSVSNSEHNFLLETYFKKLKVTALS